MAYVTISSNGDYVLDEPNGTQIRKSSSTGVFIRSNTASAVTEFGFGDEADVFEAFVGGVISTQEVINHGAGIKLMVRVSGITVGSVTIFYFPL